MDVLALQSVLMLLNQSKSENENDWMILIMKLLQIHRTVNVNLLDTCVGIIEPE